MALHQVVVCGVGVHYVGMGCVNYVVRGGRRAGWSPWSWSYVGEDARARLCYHPRARQRIPNNAVCSKRDCDRDATGDIPRAYIQLIPRPVGYTPAQRKKAFSYAHEAMPSLLRVQ